jgi:hypothetical protein
MSECAMRGKAVLFAVVTTLLVVVVGCHHDKYGLRSKHKEEVYLPPDQARFNNPPSEEYRRPPPKPQDKSLMGGGNMAMPGRMGVNPGL